MRLSEVIQSFHDINVVTVGDREIRLNIVKELKLILAQRLTIFGSTINGLGMKDGDIDLYLKGPTSMADMHESLRDIKSILEKYDDLFDDVVFISSINVPIVRLRHRATNIMVDLSQNTKMSVHNTLLLKAYTAIDPRVSMLGCFLKALAKSVGIADPPKRSLSSFGWSLMMIHYLQKIRVLPVLQEIYASTLSLFIDVDSFNDIDIGNLANHWPHVGRNEQSVRTLWLGFLKFYSKFNFNKFVITISRSKEMVKTKEYYWAAESGIAIQNPFEPDLNVAKHVFEEMSDHIIQTIRHWKNFFNKTTIFHADARTLFNDVNIKYASVPTNRVCYRCGERGHLPINCLWDNYYVLEDFGDSLI